MASKLGIESYEYQGQYQLIDLLEKRSILNSLLMEIPFQQFMKKDGKLKNFLSHLSTM